MKKISICLFALAAAVAFTPTAMAGSFGYTITGSNFTANVTFTTAATPVTNVPGPSGPVSAYVIDSVSGTFDIAGNGPVTITDGSVVNAGSADANNFADNGVFLFDNLLYTGLAGNDVLDWGGVVFEATPGYYINLFGGGFGSGNPDNSSFYFADNGSYHYNDPVVDTKHPDTNPVFSPRPRARNTAPARHRPPWACFHPVSEGKQAACESGPGSLVAKRLSASAKRTLFRRLASEQRASHQVGPR